MTLSDGIKPSTDAPLDAAELAALRQRVADGVFLGGNYDSAYQQYLIAHRDRERLLQRLDQLQQEARAQEQKLQRALAFWLPKMPNHPWRGDERLMADTFLLAGYDGPDEPDADELQWIWCIPDGP